MTKDFMGQQHVPQSLSDNCIPRSNCIEVYVYASLCSVQCTRTCMSVHVHVLNNKFVIVFLRVHGE